METPRHPDLKIVTPPQTLRELALDRLRGAIIAGHFKSGERLVERAIAEQLGVSRSVVREVIRTLEAEGLVEIPTRSGPRVSRLDWHQAEQIYDIRLRLESHAALACAMNADEATKARLASALDQLNAAFGSRTANEADQSLYEATTRFYGIIFATAGHDIAWEIVQRLNSRISRLRALTLATTARAKSGPDRMAQICKAIAANDADAAAKAVKDHLTEAASIAKRLLDAESATDEETR